VTDRTPLEEVIAAAQLTVERLSPEKYTRAFVRDLVNHAVPKLEEGRLGHRETTEDGLTNSLLALLYAAYPGATRETDTDGHVDISLKHPLHLAIVLSGEAKAINGKRFAWYTAGLTKLVAKYNSGRNDLGLMVCYCRIASMYTEMTAYKDRIGTERVAEFVRHVDPQEVELQGLKAVFVTEHIASGRKMTVAHAWVNMYSPTDKEVLGKT
jgi:hypothetical protein